MSTTTKLPTAGRMTASHFAHISRILPQALDDFLGRTNFSGNSKKIDSPFTGPYRSRTANGFDKFFQSIGPHEDELRFPSTTDNKAIVIAAIQYRAKAKGWKGLVANINDTICRDRMRKTEAAIGQIEVPDTWLMAYFADKCKNLAKGPASNARMSNPELVMLADVLRWVALWMNKFLATESRYGGEHTYSMLYSPDNVELVLAVYKDQLGKRWEFEAKDVLEGEKEIGEAEFASFMKSAKAKKMTKAEINIQAGYLYLPDPLVVNYFTNLCNRAAGRANLVVTPKEVKKAISKGALDHSTGIKS